MNKICFLNFKFKGDRDYIHGTSMFDDVSHALDLDFKKISSLKLSIYKSLRHSSAVLYEIAEISSILKEDLIALFEINHNNVIKKYALFSNDETSSNIERIEFDESIVSARSTILNNEVLLLECYHHYSFIENTVILNKHLLSNKFLNLQGKWLFTKLDIKSFSASNIRSLKIVFESNFKDKIFKSSIYVNSIHIGFIIFNLI